jgi:imidazolonepropionase-like amidohydrolase
MKLLDRITACLVNIRASRGRPAKTSDPVPLPASAAIEGRGMTIHAGWLIDGSGGRARRGVRLEIRDGVIQSLEEGSVPASGACASRPEPDFDLGGCTVIPGLTDSHVHLTMTGAVDEGLRTRLREAPFEVVRGMIRENLREHLRHGVVAVRDGGGCRGNALRFAKSHHERGQPVRVLAAGRAWHRPGRYGRLIGRPPAGGLALAEAIRQDGEPADHIKIVNSGLNSLTEYGRRTSPQFDLDEMSAAVQAAAARGLPVMVHANGEAPVRIAVMAGCRSVEHGFFMGRDNLSRMADRGVAWVPTAVTMQAYAAYYRQAGKNPDVARRTLDHQLEQLALARRLGVNVALGTDSGSPGVHHGAAVIAELGLLLQAGFTLAEAIRCASRNGAKLVGAAFGVLEKGSPATFVAVHGGPSRLPEGLRHIRAVFVHGVKELVAG